ncbi:F-box protein CPR1 [Morus notabilis]|uniref:F-box protein CPR1 n=1 Tax=Morus notabilis TaxID=981085 RepID=UPI000CED63E8|nr:F-box protein CPR1 [Morus notabilis]
MAYLPFEVIIDILARLPVKHLLRLRSVCKPWRSLIDSLDFIHLHIGKSIAAKSNLRLLLRLDSRLFSVGGDDDDFFALNDAVELPHPLMCYSNEIKILGYCNGLLCIANVAEDIAFWNPSTKTHRLLPFLPLDRTRDLRMSSRFYRVFGFGYDAVNEDYKLVRISQFIGLDYRSFESEVKIYSLRTNEWKSMEDMPYALWYTDKMGVHVNGFLHWVVIRKIELDETGLIVALDVVGESYREIPLPECMNNEYQIELGVLGGCVCVLASYKEGGFDVWAMREYGVKESWTKLLKLGHSVLGVRPLTYSKNGGDILFEEGYRKLFWYDLNSQRVKDVKIRGAPEVFEAFVCVCSLAPVTARRRRSGGRNHESGEDNNKMRDNFLSEGFKLVL